MFSPKNKRSKEKYLFSADIKYQQELGESNISERLRNCFQAHQIVLSEDLKVIIRKKPDGIKWLIKDQPKREVYCVEPNENRLDISKKIVVQTLSYPIPLRFESSRLHLLLRLSQAITNQYLKLAYRQEILALLEESDKKSYKILEPLMPSFGIPSRINRGILEMTGRTLRSINERRKLFDALVEMEDNPDKWEYRKLIRRKGVYAKSQYVTNLKEQTQNYLSFYDKMPADFFELQGSPQATQAMISYAPDDGQAIRLKHCGKTLTIQLKVPIPSERAELKWQWIETHVALPAFLQQSPILSPDLRLSCIHGRWLAVLDYKTEVECEKNDPDAEYFLTVDWGTRKLITICIFDRDGHQISPPIFLKFTPLLNKLLRIRREIDRLKSKRDRLPHKSSLWKKYNREIAKRWRKYRAINKALAHTAANVIVFIAKLYRCSDIYVEWLKGLKSKKKSPEHNWVINTTVRQAIYDKVAYKAHLSGITLNKPLPPGGSSQYCPRCGTKGYHRKSACSKSEREPYGGWFVCPDCGFNADRDYVACCNLARKVLYGNALKAQTKGVSYKKIVLSDLLFRQGSSLYREQLLHTLNGWEQQEKPNLKGSVFLRPRYLIGLLRE